MNRPSRIMSCAACSTLLLLLGCSSPASQAAEEGLSVEAGTATRCPDGLPGAPLVFIPDGEHPFCIDAREAHLGEYAKFAAAAAKEPPPQSAQCATNDRFVPTPNPDDHSTGAVDECPASLFDPGNHPDDAVQCVDWCDAKAYCEWAGKRLCDSRGSGPPLSQEDGVDPSRSEWMFVCSADGVSRYPYGDAYVAGKCIEAFDDPRLYSGSRDCVGTSPPYDQVADMVGTVAEWTAACSGGTCAIQGGVLGQEGACDFSGAADRRRALPGVGFRCCADAI